MMRKEQNWTDDCFEFCSQNIFLFKITLILSPDTFHLNKWCKMLEYQPLIKRLSFLGLTCAFLRSLRLVRICCDCGWVRHTATQRLTTRVFCDWGELVLSHRCVVKMYWCQTQTFSQSPERDARIVTQRFSWFKSSRRSGKPPHLATKSLFAAIFKDKLLACPFGCVRLRWLNEFAVLPPVYLTVFLQVTLDC